MGQEIPRGNPGDPSRPDDLAAAVTGAHTAGARDITIHTGTYNINGGGKSPFQLQGWTDTRISGTGVTLVADNVPEGAAVFSMRDCTRVTVRGLTLSQSAMTAYQGRVSAVTVDPAGHTLATWRPDAGYPVPPADSTKFPYGPNVVDVVTGRIKLVDYAASLKTTDDGFYQVGFTSRVDGLNVGDSLVGRFGDPNGRAPFKIHLVNCRDCTIEDVTLSRNGFAPVREEGGGGNHFQRCAWAPGPRPVGATVDPVVTSAADGFHSTGTNPGPDIEDCRMTGVFLDDCFAVHGSYQSIKSSDGDTITLAAKSSDLKVGQPARFCDAHGFTDQAVVTAITTAPDKTVVVTLDKKLAVPAGAKVTNPLTCGPGYKIIGCRLGNTRSRGILVKADDGVVTGNTIDGCVMSAISAGPEFYWNEADYVRGLLIEGNTISNCGKPAVWVHGEGAVGNRRVTVRGNRFRNVPSPAIKIEWTDGATVTGNGLSADRVKFDHCVNVKRDP